MTREEFLKDVSNWSNHRYLLWEALQATSGYVVELGMGQGSTPFLHQYCKDSGRTLYSYENNVDWFEKCQPFNPDNSFHITDWDVVAELHLTPPVLFLDHAPGERRQIDLKNFALRAQVIVIHDSEPAADHGYQMRQHKPKFKFWKDFETSGAWASAASNFIDVTRWQIPEQ